MINHPAPSPTIPADSASSGKRAALLSRRSVLVSAAAAAAYPLVGAGGPAEAAVTGSQRPPTPPFGPVTVFAPPAGTKDWGVKYARVAPLFSGCEERDGHRPRRLVATCENLYDPVDYAYPVFRSHDYGRSWHQIGRVEDASTGAKPRWQPFLYALPERFAGLPAGTLLCAGNTIPDDFSSTRMDIFASHDGGRRWRFLSTVAVGGPPNPANGQTPVWEPFLLLHRGRLICYYSDQRDPKHGQKLVHQISTDLVHWGPVVNDQADPAYERRPGMPTVAPLLHGWWIMTYEDGLNPDVSFGVAYKIARDPERFRFSRPHLLRTTTGLVPIGSPTVTWSPGGGRHGTIVVSAGQNEPLFINRHAGAPGTWTTLPSVVPRGYSRQVQRWGHSAVMTIGGGPGDFPAPGLNKVQFGLDSLQVSAGR